MNLPPLPAPDTHCLDDEGGPPVDVWSHSADQMTAYATAAVLAERARMTDALNYMIDCPCCGETEDCSEGCTFLADCPADAEQMEFVRRSLQGA